MNEHVFLVCGFGRCGSSLVMQMLNAGGFPVTGEHPAFEDDIVMRSASVGEWTSRLGKAVKSIDTHKFTPPSGISYRGILLSRDHKQQADSQVKFMQTLYGIALPRRASRALQKLFRQEWKPMLSVIDRLCGPTNWSALTFESLIERPFEAAVQIAQGATGLTSPPLNIEKMASVVLNRSPDCYPGLLEMELMTS